ncbi:unnamed protein product [Parnassius apollo]|uniref:(apollo) hypothetical protein n=1 Tax=Parnassius apollo TaxID=110799 RepID=A0A8S3Y4C8_PARAO|nr:unnamed protein product [Parnassius apollo]
MKYFAEMAVLFLSLQFVYVKPLPGINFKKHFEIEFSPTPLKSLELIFEKWSKFGKFKLFGIKHKIEKRDLNGMILPPSNIKEESQVLPLKVESVTSLPLPVQSVVVLSTVQPLVSSEKPPPDVVENVVMTPVVEPSDEVIQPVHPFSAIQGEQKVPSASTENTTTLPTSIALILPPVNQPPGFYTNILRTLNMSLDKGKDKQKASLPIPREENPNFIIRGSRFAMYFGSMLLRMLSQYLSGGRFTFANFPGQGATTL